MKGRAMASVYRGAAGRARVRAWCAARLDAWEVTHQRREVSTDAGPTHVVMAGQPREGVPLLVLVPGTNMNAAVSLETVTDLAQTGGVAVLDVPGQPGLSAEHRPRRARLPWYGHWLTQALEQVTSGPAIVVGHSLGAAIALAAQSPHITGRLLLSPGGLVRLAVPAPVLRATLPWLLRPTVPRSRRLLGEMSAPSHPVPEHLVEWMTLVGETCRSTLAPGPLPTDVTRRARAVPCAVAVGAHDIFLPPVRLVPAVRCLLSTEAHVLDGAGHLLLDNVPHHVVELATRLRAQG
ncbi:alpha/beta fold hydrolase [Streptomyces olivaceiscleroticus]|uniref:AB hydrolase-1 domain-containing protein n=1 Tax=Streptomyces olivaceiscleroticus TaxID=68245 RepID=A0ABP3K075_9ACTN